jgi:hypothetical protein
MYFKDIPKVVKYEPSLKEHFCLHSQIEVKGITLKVDYVDEDEVTFRLANPTLYILENGERLTPDEWADKYFYPLEPYHETTGEDTIDPISQDERGEGKTELLSDWDAGKREDNVGDTAIEEVD